jgi:hypothetical protein
MNTTDWRSATTSTRVASSASLPARIGELVRTDTDVERSPAIHTMALLAAERHMSASSHPELKQWDHQR